MFIRRVSSALTKGMHHASMVPQPKSVLLPERWHGGPKLPESKDAGRGEGRRVTADQSTSKDQPDS